MLASPNHGKFVYDGDFSDTPPPATAPNVNPGANPDLPGWEELADAGADALARLAEDGDLRDTLAGGATAASKKSAKARKAKKLSKARRAALGAYLGSRIVR